MILESQNDKYVYSDGNETELNMLKIAKEYPEDLSQDYISKNSEYTINNTFSAVRQNILNWYPFRKDAELLEIGAGMGSITGMLCDKCKSVTALEMNELRAEVIRSRYPERRNLTILNENINTWDTTNTFDYIVFVGVLEYAEIFSEAKNPFEEFLSNVKKYLKKDGIVLFAIENRFGLKYWCGAAEDHIQTPFVGIEGYKTPKTPKTFSKFELEQMLSNVGLKYNRFYYVLPDYKFPQAIFTDDFLPSYNDMQKIPFTYAKGSMLIADEKQLYKSIIENDVFDFYANSYLIEASVNTLPVKRILHVSARGESKKEYRILTTIDSEENVIKLSAHVNSIGHLRNTHNNIEYLKECGISVIEVKLVNDTLVSKFYHGIKADRIFEKYLIQNDRKNIFSLIDELKRNLLNSSEISDNTENIITNNNIGPENFNYGVILKYGFIDMTFYNSFYQDGKLTFFDQEWKFSNVPLNFILYYAVKSAYKRVHIDTQIRFEEILKYIAVDKESSVYDKLEEYIWSTVLYRQGDFYGADGYCNLYNDKLSFKERFNQLEQEICNKEERIKQLLEEEHNLQNLVISKDYEVLELKQTIEITEDKISELRQTIVTKENSITELQKTVTNQENSIAHLQEALTNQENNITELQEIATNKENSVIILQQVIINKEGHINLLLESDRELQRIKTSRSWRFMGYFWRISNVIIPHGSKRRLAVKLGVKFIKHPVSFLKKTTPNRIKKFFTVLKREGTAGVSHRVDFALMGTDIQTTPLHIDDIIENKDILDYSPLVFKAETQPIVSIIIPVYNQFEYTYNCLKAILQNSGEIPYEIIIANDCSTDLTTKIDQVVTNIKVINNRCNLGFLKNCNNAAKNIRGKYILFLNNDTQVQEDWLAPLVELIENDKTAGLVGSKLVYPDGRLQEAGGIIWNDVSAWNYGNSSDPDAPEYNYVKEVDYVSGASIIISKNLWNEIGGFDEQFAPAYCEDSDLAFEVRKRGYKVIYQPKSVVIHFEGISNGTNVNNGQKAYQKTNQIKLHNKWECIIKEKCLPNGHNVFQARDRSKEKHTILVIDHYVPQYDKDAGSRTVFEYLNLFVNMGFNVKFIGDNYYKHEPYTAVLQQMGIEVLYGPYYANHWRVWIKENAQFIHFAFLNRPHIAVKYIDFIKAHTKAKIIYYGHDLHFLRERREYELSGDKEILKSSDQWKNNEILLMRKADVVYYPSSIEVEEIKKLDDFINVKAIPAYIFDKINKVQYDFFKRRDLMFIGGFSHKPNIDAVEWLAKDIFPLIQERLPQIKIYILGSNPPEQIKALNKDNFQVKGFVSDKELADYYNNCKMSIAPLRYGAGIKGKIIEAIYFGIPVVTTPVGAEGIKDTGSILSIADDAKNFANKIIELYNDENRLSKISSASYDYIAENYSPENAIKIVESDFKN